MLRTLRPWLLMLAVLLLQQAGLQHRYAHLPSHGPGLHSWQGAQTSLSDGFSADSASAAPSGLASITWPAHESCQCGLLDHLFLGEALALAALVLGLVALVCAAFDAAVSGVVCPSLPLYQARAPPRSSFSR